MSGSRWEHPPEVQHGLGQPYRIVHLRTAEYQDEALRARRQACGYAVMRPMEGHDPHIRCPVCSTDKPSSKPMQYAGGA